MPVDPLGLLPLAVLAVLIAAFRRRGRDWRSAALAAAVIWAASVVVITEVLSLGRLLVPAAVTAAWALALAAALGCAGRRPAAAADVPTPAGQERRRGGTSLLLAGLATVLAGTLLTALVAIPDSWDAMTYHLPRVEHWIQQGSARHYPTHNLQQLYFPPLAEWTMLPLRLLGGGERLINLPAWLSGAGLILATASIAEELGGGRRAQWLAATFAATVPMVALEASSTLNDLMAAFWCAASVALLLRWRRTAGGSDGLLAAGAFALLVLTKPTGVLAALPLLLWIVGWSGRQQLARAARWVALAAATTLLLNAGHWTRNALLFEHPIGPPERESFLNDRLAPGVVVSNVLRNVALFGATPWRGVNARIEAATVALHRGLRLDPDALGTAWEDIPFHLEEGWRSEARAGAPVHLLLVGGVALALAAAPLAALRPYALALVAGFLSFCALLRWQPDNVRLLLPQLALWAPPAGIALEAARAWLRWPAWLAMIAVAVPCALANPTRSLLGADSAWHADPAQQYFRGRPRERQQVEAIVVQLRAARCRRVGLVSSPASFEYPLWALLREDGRTVSRIEHVEVRNRSRRLQRRRGGEPPCALVHLYGGVHPDELFWPPSAGGSRGAAEGAVGDASLGALRADGR